MASEVSWLGHQAESARTESNPSYKGTSFNQTPCPLLLFSLSSRLETVKLLLQAASQAFRVEVNISLTNEQYPLALESLHKHQDVSTFTPFDGNLPELMQLPS